MQQAIESDREHRLYICRLRVALAVIYFTLFLGSLAACESGSERSTSFDDTLSAGIKRSAVIPGDDQTLYKNPLIVQINAGGQYCTGRIVGQHAILTAAHCLCDTEQLEDITEIKLYADEEDNFSYRISDFAEVDFDFTDAVLGRNGARLKLEDYDTSIAVFCANKNYEKSKNDFALLRTYGPLRAAVLKLEGFDQQPTSQSTDELFGELPALNTELFLYGRGKHGCLSNHNDHNLRKAIVTLRVSDSPLFFTDTHLSNGAAAEGDSGAPFFDSNGSQVGIAVKASDPIGAFVVGLEIPEVVKNAVREIEDFACTPEKIAACIENNASFEIEGILTYPEACFVYNGSARCAWLAPSALDRIRVHCLETNWIPAAQARELNWPIPITEIDATRAENGYCLSNAGSTDFPDSCGDGSCDNGETCSSCQEDCGDCCGNGSCDNGETCSSCSTDCRSCNPFQAGQTWHGTYTCISSTTVSLDLFIRNVDGDDVEAEFIFDNPDYSWAHGSFLVMGTGSFGPTTKDLTMHYGDWVDGPVPSVSRVGMSGSVTNDGTRFQGYIIRDGTGDCGDFVVNLW